MAEYGFFIPSAGRTLIAGLLAGETLEISRVMVGSGKPQSQVKRLVAGPGVYICDECVQICLDIINEGAKNEEIAGKEAENYRLPKPKEITDILSEYVIEQDRAKKALAVAVYNHYKRING